MLKIFNTLTQKKEVFKPLDKKGRVGLYTCGPTVYWFCHIGNLRTYIFEDILKRTLQYNGYRVNQVMNITDVGHLTSDADTGEDKLEKGAKREKKTVWQIADFYTKEFKKDFKLLNILAPQKWIKATDTIKDQIEFIKKLEKKGFTYNIPDGVYFDTSKLKNYGRLWGKKARVIKAGARVDMVPGKKNPTDFALWKITPPNVKRQMEWQSPWAKGFPGWHTECVVMAVKTLAVPFDIHCGGIDHIFIHHTNEIAQSEALFGKNLAKYWLHAEFLVLKQGRMGKSEGNIIILKDIGAKKINPLAFRYLCLTCHYKSRLNFSWASLKASQNALDKLYDKVSELKTHPAKPQVKTQKYKKEFLNYINDDLNTPKALALIWKLIKGNKTSYDLLLDFDKVFGLSLDKAQKTTIPREVKELTALREKYRKQKNWPEADKIREKIETLGFSVKDTPAGSTIKKNKAKL